MISPNISQITIILMIGKQSSLNLLSGFLCLNRLLQILLFFLDHQVLCHVQGFFVGCERQDAKESEHDAEDYEWIDSCILAGCDDEGSYEVADLAQAFDIAPRNSSVFMREWLILHHRHDGLSEGYMKERVLLKKRQAPSRMVWAIVPNWMKNSSPMMIQTMFRTKVPSLLGTLVMKRSKFNGRYS